MPKRLVRDREPRQDDELRAPSRCAANSSVPVVSISVPPASRTARTTAGWRVARGEADARSPPGSTRPASPRRAPPSSGWRRRRRRGPGRRRGARAPSSVSRSPSSAGASSSSSGAPSAPPASSDRTSPVKLKSVPSPCRRVDDAPGDAQLRDVVAASSAARCRARTAARTRPVVDEPPLQVRGQPRQRERDQEEDDHHRAVDLDRVDLAEPCGGGA